MKLVITLRTDVPDEAAAQPYIDYVKQQIAQHPEVSMSASVSKTMEPPEPPPG